MDPTVQISADSWPTAAAPSDPDVVLDGVAAKAMTFLRLARAVLPGMRDAGHGRVVAVSGQNAYFTGNIVGSVRNAALIVVAKNLADDRSGLRGNRHEPVS